MFKIMTAEEAAGLINTIRPRIAIPTHYGDIIGDKKDAATFRAAVSDDIEVIEVFANVPFVMLESLDLSCNKIKYLDLLFRLLLIKIF